MTTRLYYADSFLFRFAGTVIESGTLQDGRAFAVLDRTAFYPTSGGQPYDLGRLGSVAVLDVFDRDDDDAVIHVLQAPLATGSTVEGAIDEARRRDHIQQHTGQHVLSAAYVRACHAPTVSFHMGADVSTIDVAATLDADAVARGEDEANRAVWDDRPVTVRYVGAEEAARLPLRKEPKRTGTLRIVDIADWDLSACGGTHVSSTGGIGNITVTGWERYKGGTRVAFACGRRALLHARRLGEAAGATSRLLSVQIGELPDAVGRLQADARERRQQIRTLEESLETFEAERLAATARTVGEALVVIQSVDRDASGLKALAQAIASRGPSAVLISSTRPALVVAARGTGDQLDAKTLVASLIGRFGGKGGGRPELAQAGGLDADAADVAGRVEELLGS